jgi:hypothetical protein
MNLIESAFATDPTLKQEMLGNDRDHWAGTVLEGYRRLDAKQKGAVGERITDAMLAQLGHTITSRTSPGHDSIVGGIKTEYKFSAACKDPRYNYLRQDRAMINHLSRDKDWERCVFTVINISEDKLERVDPSQIVPQLFWFTKEDFEDSIAAGTGRGNAFSAQQGGEKIGNDDYISNLKRLKENGILRPMSEW